MMKIRLKHATSWARVFAFAMLIAIPAVKGGESACYQDLNDHKFFRRWVVLSPLPVLFGATHAVAEEDQKKAFAADLLTWDGGESGVHPKDGATMKTSNHDFPWKLVESATDEVNLLSPGKNNDFSIAYAWAQLEMPEAKSALLGLGSDDAVKVWLNGKMIHENWIMRTLAKDQDILRLDLAKGTNTLLLKIQNGLGDWGFACRFIEAKMMFEKLVIAARSGDLDNAKLLVSQGADVNGRWQEQTPLHAARIAGEREMTDFLIGKGADASLPMPKPEKVIDSILSSMAGVDSPGMAVLVGRDGKILFEKGYGCASIENGVPVTPNTKFRIGSITKQFTAAAILRLQERGKLNVTNRLSQYIPDYPRGDEVTLRHLLTHTSGIHSYTEKTNFTREASLGIVPEELINSFKQDPFDFSPGEKWSYCNSGYFLLGWIVEQASGQSYADYLKKQFFDPLGMTNTGVHTATAILKHEATGYSFASGQFRKAVHCDMSKAGGAGAIYSTVEDLFRWNEAVFNGEVLSPVSRR